MIKHRLWRILEPGNEPGDRASAVFDWFILTLIVVNALAVVIDSVPRMAEEYSAAFRRFEITSVAIFTIEYGARVWTCTESERYQGRFGRGRYMLSPLAVIDFLAVAPFYLPFIGIDLRFMRILRLLRVFRIAKLTRYLTAVSVIRNVCARKAHELVIVFVLVLFVLVISACLLYFAEYQAQPQLYSDIPTTIWWTFGKLARFAPPDFFPITVIGKGLTSIIGVLGILIFALPAGILASGFVEEMRTKLGQDICPHCGRSVSNY